jgi:hypothetical protein
MLQIQSPFQQLFDTNGSPLDNGYLYIGTANANPEVSPIPLWWDDAGTIPAAQPIRTQNGYIVRNGTPARVYTSTSNYSLTAKNKNGIIIFTLQSVYSTGGSEEYRFENKSTIDKSFSVGNGKNAMSAGPLTILDGVVITIPTGSVWHII